MSEEEQKEHIRMIFSASYYPFKNIDALVNNLYSWHQQELERAVAEARIQALRPFVKALRDPGSHPAYHFEQVERLKSEWPTLYHLLMHAEDDLTNKKEGK